MKRIVLAILGVAAIAVSAWAQKAPAKPDEKTLADAIELHSSKAKMPGRVEIRDDPDGAVRLQRQFKPTALGTPLITPPPALPMFDNKELRCRNL
jgi:hypothetical protein